MKFADYKIIKTGNIYELYKPFKSYLLNNGKHEKQRSEFNIEDREEEYKARSIQRAKTNIRRLINTNFNSNSQFITLTFNPNKQFNIKNIKDTTRRFKYFVKNLEMHFNIDLRYLSIYELQKNLNIHYHVVTQLPEFIPNDRNLKKYNNCDITLNELWGYGFTKINNIDSCNNVGAYISKYLTKETFYRLPNSHSYIRSRNLLSPEIIYTNFPQKYLPINYPKYAIPQMEKFYMSEFQGLVHYQQFNCNVA